jgi:hypothetical protein
MSSGSSSSSKFSKRHYEMVAELIQEFKWSTNYKQGMAEQAGKDSFARGFVTAVDGMQLAMEGLFARDNGMFDRGRFERACVVGANVKNRVK